MTVLVGASPYGLAPRALSWTLCPDDERFSVILSKAFVLADDDKIRDQTIPAQIRR